ncbi:hypothetical protein A2115_01685 [Candidatus Woesebacteria bacterium GWA1_41_8]|jgi:hypothetical protein|uniref:Uncharacterized protein n=1 Tax=Candidatus Woesebacteria bacterium GWA1_41_8 TaxID=1802471 RepID=A0A1F7WIX0_9BACT|nr:MAG: hypothetical protein A2115_01685 [Candidatus Woesebacteria bacterium GWA1_41_8]
MLKNAIAPIQAWLLSQGRCVGCGKPLADKKRASWKNETEKFTCDCGRIYVYNLKSKKYRRALLEEV